MSGLTDFIERPPKERIRDWSEIRGPIPDNLALREAVRCNFCFESPCVEGCPAGVDVGAFIRRIKVGDLKSAIRIIKESNPFAGVCGRVCPAEDLCIAECRSRFCTEPVDIAALQRYAADAELLRAINPPQVTRNKRVRKVACVGAGPAGLTCAAELSRRGYSVTVFEKNNRAGGMLTYGIPSYRLPQDIVDSEVDYIKKFGVKILTGREITDFKKLKSRGLSAVFVGTGAWKSSRLDIPGTDLDGVWDALDFIAAAKHKGKKPRIGKTVAVLGGGNTAMDCVGTALRLGAGRVLVIYRRSRAEMPAWGIEVSTAFFEGAEFMFLTAPKRILGKKGVQALECVKMKLGKKDRSGRPRPISIPGSEFTIDVDTVIQAVGQQPDREMIKRMGLKTDKKGGIKIKKNGSTNIPGVFAGGDAVSGGGTAVEAIAAGKAAAGAIDRYIRRQYDDRR